MHRFSNQTPRLYFWIGIAIFLTISCPLLLAQGTAKQPNLTEIWHADLGPVSDSAFYRLAVCPDGFAYLTDGQGRVVMIDGSGKVLSDTRTSPELSGSVAVACNDRGRLVSASPRFLVTMERKGSHLEPSSVLPWGPQKPRPHQIVIADDAILFVVGALGGKFYVHAMDWQGTLLTSFGDAPRQATRSLEARAAARGSAVWNKSTQRLTYLPMNPFEARVYDRNGTLMASRGNLDPGFKEMLADPATGTYKPDDEVTYATYLPSDELVVQTLKREDLPAGRYNRNNYLNILDTDLRLTRMIPIGPNFGVLQGSSADGTLYFARINVPTGIRIIAAKLAP